MGFFVIELIQHTKTMFHMIQTLQADCANYKFIWIHDRF